MEKGTINVQSENIFPIIKKFLYSDHEIFLRELVSNAVDATQKLKGLASMGEFKGELADINVKVKINKELKTLTISDKLKNTSIKLHFQVRANFWKNSKVLKMEKQ